MKNVSRILQRNLERLPPGSILLVDPEPDAPVNEISARSEQVSISTSSHGAVQRFRAAGRDVFFEAAPVEAPARDHVVLCLPREKERLDMLLHAAAQKLPAGGRLWLAGAKRSGIASSPRRLERHFDQVRKLDSASHCSLFEARGPDAGGTFRLDDYETTSSIHHAGQSIRLSFLPGVFARGRLDPGTDLLLQTLESHPVSGRILDFASGCGVVGASILKTRANSNAVLLDDSAIAIEAGKRTLAANGLAAVSLPSDGLGSLSGSFDWIVSNPPFHRGVEQDVSITAGFFGDAGTFLSENGRIRVVFNRHLPYTGWLRQSYNRVDCLAQTRTFTVIEASKKK